MLWYSGVLFIYLFVFVFGLVWFAHVLWSSQAPAVSCYLDALECQIVFIYVTSVIRTQQTIKWEISVGSIFLSFLCVCECECVCMSVVCVSLFV